MNASMAAHKRAELTAARIRAAAGPGVILPSEVTASRVDPGLQTVPALPAGVLHPSGGPQTLATAWRVDTARIDAKGRIPAKAIAQQLKWTAGQTVTGEADPDSGFVTLRDGDIPAHRQVTARVDAKGRLLLKAGVRAARCIPEGGQSSFSPTRRVGPFTLLPPA